ncbi:MAG: dipeptidase PepE [Bacteroidetes bacterium]|nr:MAG: dipeptidase PepE [Bacteroidota bacterium]
MSKLLLISNSTMAGEAYLGWPQQYIKDFLKNEVKRVLFIPYAGVNLSDKGLQASWDAYEERVATVYKSMGYELYSIHNEADPIKAVEEAESIAVGGGNTFYLFKMMQETGIMPAIKKRVEAGMPYMGWSAGSNSACPSLKTTNDMPIVEPSSFDGIGIIPFQINPHYLDAHPDGHGGETREQRLEEFMAVNPDMYIVGLREACLLQMEGDKMELKGKHSMRIFKHGQKTYEVQPGDDLSFLF